MELNLKNDEIYNILKYVDGNDIKSYIMYRYKKKSERHKYHKKIVAERKNIIRYHLLQIPYIMSQDIQQFLLYYIHSDRYKDDIQKEKPIIKLVNDNTPKGITTQEIKKMKDKALRDIKSREVSISKVVEKEVKNATNEAVARTTATIHKEVKGGLSDKVINKALDVSGDVIKDSVKKSTVAIVGNTIKTTGLVVGSAIGFGLAKATDGLGSAIGGILANPKKTIKIVETPEYRNPTNAYAIKVIYSDDSLYINNQIYLFVNEASFKRVMKSRGLEVEK